MHWSLPGMVYPGAESLDTIANPHHNSSTYGYPGEALGWALIYLDALAIHFVGPTVDADLEHRMMPVWTDSWEP